MNQLHQSVYLNRVFYSSPFLLVSVLSDVYHHHVGAGVLSNLPPGPSNLPDQSRVPLGILNTLFSALAFGSIIFIKIGIFFKHLSFCIIILHGL